MQSVLCEDLPVDKQKKTVTLQALAWHNTADEAHLTTGQRADGKTASSSDWNHPS